MSSYDQLNLATLINSRRKALTRTRAVFLMVASWLAILPSFLCWWINQFGPLARGDLGAILAGITLASMLPFAAGLLAFMIAPVAPIPRRFWLANLAVGCVGAAFLVLALLEI